MIMNTVNDEILDIKQLADLIKLDRQTIYYLTSNRLIPYMKPTGKLLFMKSEIMKWLNKSRIPTQDEMNDKIKNQ